MSVDFFNRHMTGQIFTLDNLKYSNRAAKCP